MGDSSFMIGRVVECIRRIIIRKTPEEAIAQAFNK